MNVIVIVGPTAVGKTKVSIDLAKEFNGEIISADSMQVYKFMDIGTAKPNNDEMGGIKHFLIDEIEPSQDFSVAQYKEKATKYIDDVLSRGKIPIVVGGTGLYINSLIYNIQFSEVLADNEYRDYLYKIAEQKGNEYLYEILMQTDSQAALKIHINDTKRIIRALEVYKSTGEKISTQVSNSRMIESKYHFIIIGLTLEREILYQRINERVDQMINQGLIEEVEMLISKGYLKNSTSMQAIGYKEMVRYLDNEISLEEAVQAVKQESRRYAKRQMTWLRRIEEIKWYDITNMKYNDLLIEIKDYLNKIFSQN